LEFRRESVRREERRQAHHSVLTVFETSLEIAQTPDGAHLEAGQSCLELALEGALFERDVQEHEQLR
jgi:hypothetical protein